MSWIHIHDVIRIYMFALENEKIHGVYNMTAPQPVTNSEMTQSLGLIFNKKLWLPNVPAFGLRLILGELSDLLLDSAKVSSSRIEAAGFSFDYPDLSHALRNIYID